MIQQLLQDGKQQEVLDAFAALLSRNKQLELQLAQLRRNRNRSEKVSSAQLGLFFQLIETQPTDNTNADDCSDGRQQADEQLKQLVEPDSDAEVQAKDQDKPNRKRKPKSAGRQQWPAHLPRIPNIILVPAHQRDCPKCGGERRCIGFDESERLEFIPAQLVVYADAREKLACDNCESEVVRAPLADKVTAQGKVGPRLVANILYDKYWDGLSLHRQSNRFSQLGLFIAVSTLADLVADAASQLDVLWQLAMQQVLHSTVMHMDGTGLPVLDSNADNNKRVGALWGYVGDNDAVVYVYNTTGKKVGQQPGELGPQDVLDQRTGYVVADASNLFDASFKRDDLIECGCNAHSRRGFIRALDSGDHRAALPIAAYKKLYKIERDIRDLSAEAKLAERQAKSKPIFDELLNWCEAHRPFEPPSQPMGKAIGYMLNHQQALGRFLTDGVIPIDNSKAERLHVRVAIGRKNYLFVGSDAGGMRAAVIYTLLGCCAYADADPIEYFTDVLPRLNRGVAAQDLPDLMPKRWKHLREHQHQQ